MGCTDQLGTNTCHHNKKLNYILSKKGSVATRVICSKTKFIKRILRSINITLFRSTTMLCGTDNILWNNPQLQTEYEKYSAKYYESHITLLWI